MSVRLFRPTTKFITFKSGSSLEQHFLIWGKFTPGGKFPRFRG